MRISSHEVKLHILTMNHTNLPDFAAVVVVDGKALVRRRNEGG